jgi:nucleoside-diphosphate-sugar epimerase
MSVLVTGAAGSLGGALVSRLLASGECMVRCFVRPNSDVSRLEDLRKQYPQARIEYIVGNLASSSAARRAVQGIRTVYHLAAAMRGAPATIFHDTVVASQSLLRAIESDGAPRRVVLTSSLSVYDTSKLAAGYCITEDCALDPHPEKRDAYSHAKIWQEQLFRDYAAQHPIDLVVLRPGVLYGSRSKAFPSRVGIVVGDLLLQFGDVRNPLPLSHVDNCADAMVLAGVSPKSSGGTYNVIDDDLPTIAQYVSAYKLQVAHVPSVHIPYVLVMVASHVIARYCKYSRGQIPALVTPYKTAAIWKGHRFDNQRIKTLGWKQEVPTVEALRHMFATFRAKETRPDRGLLAKPPHVPCERIHAEATTHAETL